MKPSDCYSEGYRKVGQVRILRCQPLKNMLRSSSDSAEYSIRVLRLISSIYLIVRDSVARFTGSGQSNKGPIDCKSFK